MTALAWCAALLWGLILLRSARPGPAPLPEPGPITPPYALILLAEGEPPPLDPSPTQVIRPDEGLGGLDEGLTWCLLLDPSLQIPPDLPARLMTSGVGLTSVLPHPSGGPLNHARERALRDFAQPERVIDVLRPEAYADPRCAWGRLEDVRRLGTADPLALARARKARCAEVMLYEGRDASRRRWVIAPRLSGEAWRALKPRVLGPDPLVRALMRWTPPVICYGPLLITPFSPRVGLLTLGLGGAARLMTASRDGFGYLLSALGWLIDPLPWLRAPAKPEILPFPEAQEAMQRTGPESVKGGAWLERAATPYLARKLGGGAPVMEHIYDARPIGRDALGRFIDGIALGTPAARAVRHRLHQTRSMVQARRPARILSVPCGGGRDLEGSEAERLVLVDPDPEARRLAQARIPHAEVIDATIESAPEGPFDLILFIGLSEYFEDEALLRHLIALKGRLGEGGVLLCSGTAEHAQREEMARWFGWRTRARSPKVLRGLLERAGFEVPRGVSDPFEVQWIFEARPRRFNGGRGI